MKVPTERCLSWGYRDNLWSLIGDVREVIYLHSHFGSKHRGALRWLHSTHLMGKLNIILVLK